MKRFIISVFVCLLSLFFVISFTGCAVKGSGVIVTKIFSPAPKDFTEVEIQGIYNFEIVKSEEYKVEITADDNIFNYLNVDKEGEILKMGINEEETYRGITLRVTVSMPELKSLSLSGECNGVFKGFDIEDKLLINLYGSNTINEGVINGNGNLKIEMDGYNSVNLSGEANKLELEMIDSNSLNMKGTSGITEAQIEMSGSNVAVISIDGNVYGEISGSSMLYLHGNPVLKDLVTKGSSDVELID